MPVKNFIGGYCCRGHLLTEDNVQLKKRPRGRQDTLVCRTCARNALANYRSRNPKQPRKPYGGNPKGYRADVILITDGRCQGFQRACSFVGELANGLCLQCWDAQAGAIYDHSRNGNGSAC